MSAHVDIDKLITIGGMVIRLTPLVPEMREGVCVCVCVCACVGVCVVFVRALDAHVSHVCMHYMHTYVLHFKLTSFSNYVHENVSKCDILFYYFSILRVCSLPLYDDS